MAEYFVAKSYAHYERIGEPFEKMGRLYTKAKCKCDRCTRGVYAIGVHNGELVPHPNANGVCFKCNGTGYVEKEIRLYTEKEYARLQKAEETHETARQVEAMERAAHVKEQSAAKKLEWFEKNGFNKEGCTYAVYGDDTYAIKEHLKELGCKFHPIFKWHSPEMFDLPEGYNFICIKAEDYMVWNYFNMEFKEDAAIQIERLFRQAEGPSKSEYMDAEVGDRLRNLTVVLKSQRGFSGQWGWTNIFTFACGDNVLVWFTSSDKDFTVGKAYNLTGTVKKFEEYKGVKTTQLSRCIIKEIEA